MSKYNVWLPYKMFVVKEVEAESEEEAKQALAKMKGV